MNLLYVILIEFSFVRMDSAGQISEHGDTVTLENFYCHSNNLFILVDTTAPPPKKSKYRKKPPR